MKNKNMTAVIGLLGIVILAILGYQVLGGRANNVEVSQDGTGEESMPKTLLGLMALGDEMKCTYSYEDEAGATEGRVYIAGGKSRSDYTVKTAEGEDFSGSVITGDEYSYVWGSMMEGGLKMKRVDEVDQETEGAPVTSDYAKLDEEMNYQCEPWVADQSKFTPPSNVEFRDLGAMMDDAKIQQCAMCGSLDGEAKTACEQQFGCN